jgi:hypothetical protein
LGTEVKMSTVEGEVSSDDILVEYSTREMRLESWAGSKEQWWLKPLALCCP